MTLFHRLGRFAARRRRLILGAWALLILAALPLAPRAPGALRAGGFSSDDLDAARARHTLEQELELPPSALVIVLQSETAARAGDPAFEAAAAQAIADVPHAQHVASVLTHTLAPDQVSADGRTVYEVVTLDLPPDDSPAGLGPIEDALKDVPGVRTYLAGGPAFYGDIQHVTERDLQRSEVISLPLAGLALLLVFGSVFAAGVPIIVGGASVLVALAIVFLVASATPMSIFVLNLATLLGFGLGVDYALLLTNRFREELGRRGGGRLPDGRIDRAAVDEAVAVTVSSAGRAVFFSGLTVLLGLFGLVLFDFMVLRSVGIAGAIVVALAVTAAVTLLPAILAFLGPNLDALAVRPMLSRLRARLSSGGTAVVARESPLDTAAGSAPAPLGEGRWARLARWVMDRPVRVFVPTLGLLIVLGAPFLHARFNAPDASILPRYVPSREAYDLLVNNFDEGRFAPLLLAVRTDGPVTDPANVRRLYDYSRRLAADPRITRVESVVDIDPRLSREQYQLLLSNPGGPGDRFVADALRLSARGDLASFQLLTPYGPNRLEARGLVEELRDPRSALAPPPGLSVSVGGGAAEVKDVVDRVAQDFPRTALFILISTYLVLFLLLRSVVLPAKALVMNTLSIVASFGALVWIFQDGNLSAILGFEPLGFVETTQPVILFCVLFGLSMDYEVFLLSRMKEIHDRTGDNREAVAGGLERSGRIVTSAALIVVVVAGSFAFADIVLIKALGIGVALAVALDATVVRALLVPSTMRLLGEWNWWMPRRLARWIGQRLPVVEGATLATLGQLVALALVAALLLGACSPGGRVLGVDPTPAPTSPPATLGAVALADPQPVTFPRDDAAHRRLTEWWYYTGHLRADDGRRFGFEFVIFRAERGSFPVTWASHLGLTDESGKRFLHEERTEIGPQVDVASAAALAAPAAAPSAAPAPTATPPAGFNLAIRGGASLTRQGAPGASGTTAPSPGAAEPWTMAGANGRDRLRATGAGFGIDLGLDAGARTPVLHDHDGWVDFGPGGGSYYYSRTRRRAQGSLWLGGEQLAVDGIAWFDHQWGDFISVGSGGWDWFAVNLDDGTDLTLSLVRDRNGGYPLVYGTLVHPDGRYEHLDRAAFAVTPTGQWTSPRTGARYPSGWHVELPGEALVVDLTPTLQDQELDTRSSTGVVYWEGSQVVRATRAGVRLGGEAYVELTGYGPGTVAR